MRRPNAGNSMIMSRMLSFAVCKIEGKRPRIELKMWERSKAWFDRMEEFLLGDSSCRVIMVGREVLTVR
jgi:hypothetical protein